MPQTDFAHQPTAANEDVILETLLKRRHSCRSFQTTPVPRDTIERILSLAQRTASWCNSQPWQLTIISGAALDQFRTIMLEQAQHNAGKSDIAFPTAYTGPYRDRRRACGIQLYKAVGVTRDDPQGAARQALENFRFFDAPHAAIVTTQAELGPYGAVDCGAYVSNFMLAAQSLGVATIAQAALANHSQAIKEHLSISTDRHVVCGISFGFENDAHPANQFRTARASVNDVVTWVD
jgi:nitroreductase